MSRRYTVDFMDKWEGLLLLEEDEFDDLEEAKAGCDKKEEGRLSNKYPNEYYCVVDRETGWIVYPEDKR